MDLSCDVAKNMNITIMGVATRDRAAYNRCVGASESEIGLLAFSRWKSRIQMRLKRDVTRPRKQVPPLCPVYAGRALMISPRRSPQGCNECNMSYCSSISVHCSSAKTRNTSSRSVALRYLKPISISTKSLGGTDVCPD